MNAWTDPLYLVRRIAPSEFTVAKFTDRKEPEKVYEVTRLKEDDWWTDSPGYGRMGQQEKHIRLVKRWIRDGEPEFTAYTISDDGTFPSFRFGSL